MVSNGSQQAAAWWKGDGILQRKREIAQECQRKHALGFRQYPKENDTEGRESYTFFWLEYTDLSVLHEGRSVMTV